SLGIIVEGLREVAGLDQQLVGQGLGWAAVAADRAVVGDKQRQTPTCAAARQKKQVGGLNAQPAAGEDAGEGEAKQERLHALHRVNDDRRTAAPRIAAATERPLRVACDSLDPPEEQVALPEAAERPIGGLQRSGCYARL